MRADDDAGCGGGEPYNIRCADENVGYTAVGKTAYILQSIDRLDL